MSEEFKSLREVMQEILNDPERARVLGSIHVEGASGMRQPPSCPRCGGAGWLRVDVAEPNDPNFGKIVPCPGCAEQMARKREARLHERGSLLVTPTYQGMRFESFVPRPEQYAAYMLARCYADQPYVRPFLTLCGDPGGGKSHLAAAIAFAFNEQHDYPVVYTAQDLLEEIQASFGREHDDTARTELVLHSFKDGAKLLVLDELGAHHGTDWAESELYGIVNARYSKGLPTVITSNVPLGDLGKRPSMSTGDARWASRLTDIRKSAVVVLDVHDMRRRDVPTEPATAPRFSSEPVTTAYHRVREKLVVCPICHCLPCYDQDGVRCPELER